MPSPFPGMDPYLEGRIVWPDVHHNLISAIQTALAPRVAPAYYVAIEQRVTLLEMERGEQVREPDASIIPTGVRARPAGGVAVAEAPTATALTVLLPSYEEVREGYLEIRDVRDHLVVTAIEVLSPTNKMRSEGRQEYEKKRREVLSRLTGLVEIDLLRAGAPMEMEPLPASDYRILVSAEWERPRARLLAFGIRDPLPAMTVPLREGEEEARLSLGDLLPQLYDRARYDLRLDYSASPPEPPLSPEDATWVRELVRPGAAGAETTPQP